MGVVNTFPIRRLRCARPEFLNVFLLLLLLFLSFHLEIATSTTHITDNEMVTEGVDREKLSAPLFGMKRL